MKRQRIDLDSESVLDYDINTALYTPLPEPKIMQVVRTNQRPALMSTDLDWPIRALYFRCHHHRRSPGSTKWVSSRRSKLIPFNFAIDTLKTICIPATPTARLTSSFRNEFCVPKNSQDQNTFGFSTLTRNKSKSSGRSCPVSNVDQYLLQGDQKDSVVRFSFFGHFLEFL